DLLPAFLQFPEFLRGAFQHGAAAVNACAFFHRLLHLLPDGGDALLAVARSARSSLAQKVLFHAALLIAALREDSRSEFRRRLRCECGGSFPGTGPEHQALRQGVRTKAICAVDAYTRDLTG